VRDDEPRDDEPPQSEIDRVARGILARYATPKEARAAVYYHAMDYRPDTERRVYWLRVYETLIALSPDVEF